MLAAAGPITPKDPKSEAQNAHTLDLTLLGTFKARVNESTLRFPTRKAKAVLAYVALGEVTGESRERLLGLLWSESDSVRARNSLRRAVKEVNDVLAAAGFVGFTSHKQTLVLDRSMVSIDVTDIQRAADSGLADPRLLEGERIADKLLADIELVDPQFQAWVRAKRHALHDRLTHALERALPTEIGGGESVDLGQALLNLDPTHEAACRHVIRARIARNEIGGALKAYKTLWDELAEEFDTEPSGETQELIVKIKQQAGWSVRPDALEDRRDVAVVLPKPREPAAPLRHLFIAVAPFEVEGVDQSVRHVINGFRHEIIATLARFREWSVRSQTNMAQLGGAQHEHEQEYKLFATAYGGPERFRLVVTLEDPQSSIVWSQPFTLLIAEFQQSEQYIVQTIAIALKINLSADRMRRMSIGRLLPSDLYDSWMRGQDLALSFERDKWQEAHDIFDSLVRAAPSFSPAHSGLAQTANSRHIIIPGVFRSRADHTRALQIGQTAVRLDPSDARAHLCVAWAHLLLGRGHEATLHANLAVELNPNDPWPQIAAAQIFAYCADHARALELANRSLELTPTSTPGQLAYLSAIHFLAGRYEESVDIGLASARPTPAFAIWQVAALAHLDRSAEAQLLLGNVISQLRSIWAGERAPSNQLICEWLMHIFPMAFQADWERLRQGLTVAGAELACAKFRIG